MPEISNETAKQALAAVSFVMTSFKTKERKELELAFTELYETVLAGSQCEGRL